MTIILFMLTAALSKKVRSLYKQLQSLEEEKYDWELKIRRQDYEVRHIAFYFSYMICTVLLQ